MADLRFSVALLELVLGLVLHLLQGHLVEERYVLVWVNADEHISDVGVDGVLARRRRTRESRGRDLRVVAEMRRARERAGEAPLSFRVGPKSPCVAVGGEL